MKNVAIVTESVALYEKMRLILLGLARVDKLNIMPSPDAYDAVFFDARGERGYALFCEDEELSLLISGDEGEAPSYPPGAIPIVWGERSVDGAVGYPFEYDEILSYISSEGGKRLRLYDRVAVLDGRDIALSRQEAELLSLLIGGGGEYVSRERLTEALWGESGTPSRLNVYIHYLREKLESEGEKIILASRREGYRIDEKFLGGGNA